VGVADLFSKEGADVCAGGVCSSLGGMSLGAGPASLFWLVLTLKYTKLIGSASLLITRRTTAAAREDQ
jgi:hypothetical protein